MNTKKIIYCLKTYLHLVSFLITLVFFNTVPNQLQELRKELAKHSSKYRAEISRKFFKTGKGEYGEGDVFLGLTVPNIRKIAKKYSFASLKIVQELLNSKIHEERLLALFILVDQFKMTGNEKIVRFYLKNTKKVNNWDLVDSSADKILGNYLLNKPKNILYKLANSSNLWERRISILSTFEFIRNNKFEDSLEIAEILLNDKQDLIHKAVGWMLREVGKRNQTVLEKFLKKYYKRMPRTMLRYAIEKFDERRRKEYLSI